MPKCPVTWHYRFACSQCSWTSVGSQWREGRLAGAERTACLCIWLWQEEKNQPSDISVRENLQPVLLEPWLPCSHHTSEEIRSWSHLGPNLDQLPRPETRAVAKISCSEQRMLGLIFWCIHLVVLNEFWMNGLTLLSSLNPHQLCNWLYYGYQWYLVALNGSGSHLLNSLQFPGVSAGLLITS